MFYQTSSIVVYKDVSQGFDKVIYIQGGRIFFCALRADVAPDEKDSAPNKSDKIR